MRTTFNGRGLTMVLGIAMAAGCASTEMTNTWFDPAAMGAPLQKVAVVCLTKDEGMRRMAETQAASQIKGTQVRLGVTAPPTRPVRRAELPAQQPEPVPEPLPERK